MLIKRKRRSRLEQTTTMDVRNEKRIVKQTWGKHGDGKSFSKVFSNSSLVEIAGMPSGKVEWEGVVILDVLQVLISINTIWSTFKLLCKKYMKETH